MLHRRSLLTSSGKSGAFQEYMQFLSLILQKVDIFVINDNGLLHLCIPSRGCFPPCHFDEQIEDHGTQPRSTHQSVDERDSRVSELWMFQCRHSFESLKSAR